MRTRVALLLSLLPLWGCGQGGPPETAGSAPEAARPPQAPANGTPAPEAAADQQPAAPAATPPPAARPGPAPLTPGQRRALCRLSDGALKMLPQSFDPQRTRLHLASGGHTSWRELLREYDVSAAVGLTAAQEKALMPVWARLDGGTNRLNLMKLPPREHAAELEKVRRAAEEEFERILPNVLDPARWTRLREVRAVRSGAAGLADPLLAAALGLIAAQEKQIAAILGEDSRPKAERQPSVLPPATFPGAPGVLTRALGVLTEEQKHAWAEIGVLYGLPRAYRGVGH